MSVIGKRDVCIVTGEGLRIIWDPVPVTIQVLDHVNVRSVCLIGRWLDTGNTETGDNILYAATSFTSGVSTGRQDTQYSY